MDGDYYDSYDDELYDTEKLYKERYITRKQMKQRLQKWKGYSSMNDSAKLEADLQDDAVERDYTVLMKKKHRKKNSKSRRFKLGASGADQADNIDSVSDEVKFDQSDETEEFALSDESLKDASGPSNESDLKDDDELFVKSHRRIDKIWAPKLLVHPGDTEPCTSLTSSNMDAKRSSKTCGTYWPDTLVAGQRFHRLNEIRKAPDEKPL